MVELEHRIGSSETSERLNTQHANNAMRKANLSTAMTAFTLSLASLTPSIDDLHAADIFTKVTNGLIVTLAGSGRGCAWGDYNNDGFLDLFVSNLNGQNNLLYRNNGNKNHWLMIQCLGRVSNRSGIGAKVRIQTSLADPAKWKMREISGGNGYASQNALDAHFGLGNETNVETVRIEWPSGIVQELKNIAADQRLRVREPSHLSLVSPSREQPQLELRGLHGLKYAIERSINLTEWTTVLITTNLIAVTPLSEQGLNRQEFYRAIELEE